MSKQQRTLLITAAAVLAAISLFVYVSVQRARELEQQAADMLQEFPPTPTVVVQEPDLTAVIQESKQFLKAIADAIQRLEEGHAKRIAFKERGQPFPDDLDASFRHLRLDTVKRLQQLDTILDDNLRRTSHPTTTDELLALRKQSAALRTVVMRTDFGFEPPTK